MPLDTRIALGVQPIQIADPMAQYSQFAQARAAGNQNALAQYQLGSAQRADVQANALNEAYAGATDPNTGEIDYGKVRNFLAQKGAGSQIPGVIKGQAEYQKAQTEAQKAQSDLVDAKLKQSRQFLDTIDPAAPGAVNQYLAWHQANHADPVLGPILKARGVTADQSRATIEAAVAQGPQAFADLINKSKLGTEKFMEMNKPTLTPQNLGGTERIMATPGLGGAATVVPGSTGIVTEKPLESPLAKLQSGRQKLINSGIPENDPRVRQYDAMILKETTHAPAASTQVNVSQNTEKKYGEAFGGKIADRDVAMLDVAAKAPDLAANANRVLSILSQGNVFTGSAADIKLNMARALNLAGAGNDEKIANTEMLVSGLARQTLGAVKSSGLGTGQGFTDKDLQFLQDAEGGRITLNAQTIQRLAELSHSAADKSATAWNKRVKEIPKSATEGTGLSTEPIVVPKRLGAAPAAPAAGAVQNGYRFKGGDPAVAANWEKL